jgi:hypothetical protein
MDNFYVSTLQYGLDQNPHQHTGRIRENEMKQNSLGSACTLSPEEGDLQQPKESILLPADHKTQTLTSQGRRDNSLCRSK